MQKNYARIIGLPVVILVVAAFIFSWLAESGKEVNATPVAAGGEINVEAALSERVLGDDDAAVTMYEYSSLTCGHCGSFHRNTLPEIKEKLIETGKLRLVFVDFPLNAPALDASMIARCMPEDRYFSFLELLFETQDSWAYSGNYRDILRQSARLAGMNNEAFDSCLNNTDLRQGLVARMQESAEKWSIQSTPSFVFNDGAEQISGAQSFAAFERVVEKLR